MCVSCFIFSLYIVDINLDTFYYNENATASAIVMFIFTIMVVPLASVIFYYFRDRTRNKLDQKLQQGRFEMRKRTSRNSGVSDNEISNSDVNIYPSVVSSSS